MPTLKSKGIVSVFRARINRFDEDFGFLSEGIFLGSGLIIPNEVKTGYIEDMEVSHAYPVLPFRKPDGTDQPFLSPLSLSPVPMTGTSSAAFFTLSNMDFSGRMLPRNMVRTRRCTIGSSGGAGSVFSAGSSPSWQTRRPLMAR